MSTPPEQYELQDVLAAANAPLVPRDSEELDFSTLFDDIEAARGRHSGDFHEDYDFQTVWAKYKGQGGFSRRNVIGGFVAVTLLWVTATLVYAHTTPRLLVSLMRWKTNVVLYGGMNVTLNPYDPDHRATSLTNWRRGEYYVQLDPVQWLAPKQYPKGTPGGYYLLRTIEQQVAVERMGSDFREIIIDGTFPYGNDFIVVDRVILNPAHAFDDKTHHHLVVSDTLTQWRYSTFAVYWVYDLVTGELVPLQPPKKEVEEDEKQEGRPLLEKLHFAEFSPSGHKVVFGWDHNLYVQDLQSGELQKITTSGSPTIYNGKPDWVYEEEIFPQDRLVWWSPDSTGLAYAVLNDTDVLEYEIDYYIKDADEIGSAYTVPQLEKVDGVHQYPTETKIRYPKPGTPNPRVTMKYYNLEQKKTLDIPLELGDVPEALLYDATWLDSESLLIKLADRTSTIESRQIFRGGEVQVVGTTNAYDEYHGWVEKTPDVLVLPDGYIDRVVVHGRSHLALFDLEGKQIKRLTDLESWEVDMDSPVVYNAVEKVVYCLVTERSSMDAHLVAIDIESGKKRAITSPKVDGKYTVNFSPDGQYLDLVYRGPGQPWQRLLNMADVHDWLNEHPDADEYIESIGYSNDHHYTKDILEKTNVPTKVYRNITVEKPDGGSSVTLNVVEILPPNFDPNKKYPLVVEVYGGPGSVLVDKAWLIGFSEVMCSSAKAVVLQVDPRGTGQAWKSRSYATNNLGYWEPRDLTTLVSEYVAVNKHIDKTAVALWGWSYGGFVTLKTLEYDGGKTFGYGMAVAPVTNFMFYDSVYTERYLGPPGDTYKNARITDFDKFKDVKRFLVMHGTGDDNVHFQNTLWFMERLTVKGVKNFDLEVFPDSNHNMDFHLAQNAVFDKLLAWVQDAFAHRLDSLA